MNKHYKTTSLKCECGGTIVMDTAKLELYCTQCSLVMESQPLTELIKNMEERRNIK